MTIDKTRLPVPAGELPKFAVVPRQCQRHDGWTAERQRGFIAALADTGSVRAAAHAVNMTPEGAYLLRRHSQAADFRAAWEAALSLGVQRLEDVAMERALHGVEVPVYSFGKLVGSRTVHNDRLVMFMLRNRAPGRFTGGQAKAMNAVDKMELTRLKAQWRKEWEAGWLREQAVAANDRDRTAETGLVENIAQMHERWYTTLGPRTRAAYRSFRETEIAEDTELHEQRWVAKTVDLVQEDLAAAPDEWTAEDLRDELTEAQAAAAAAAGDAALAKAEYAEWFDHERRAKVWWAIDVVFGALSAGDVGDGE